jgi:hypothetical protein
MILPCILVTTQQHIVMDLLEALLGNGSINTPSYDHATIGRILQLVPRKQYARQWTRCVAVTWCVFWRSSHRANRLAGYRTWYVFCAWSVPRSYIEDIEYLHRDPASRRRRRKGKFQNWDSKIWSRDPRDSDPRKIVLERAQQHIQKTDPSSRQRGRPTKTRP